MSETDSLIAGQDADEAITAQVEAEARNRLVDLVQGLDVIVWEMDAVTWKFTFVSDRAQDVLGYPICQWFDEPQFWQDRLLHPEDRDWCINYCITATNEARNHEFQYRAIAADGRVVWLKNLVRVVCDSQGSAKLLGGLMVDITKEKEAEEKNQQLTRQRAARVEVKTVQAELRKNEERYRSLIEATSEIIWDTNPEGALVTEQPGWSAFTGQTYEEYKGWGWLNAIHPDDQFDTAQAWLNALTNRSLYEVEHRLRRYDGEYRYMSVRAVPVLEANSSIREWVGVHTDITERKQVQEALRKSEERYRSLVEATAQIIWETKAEGEFVTEQPGWSAFTGQTYDELKGSGWLKAVHPDDRANIAKLWSAAIANRTLYQVEHRLRRYDGEYRYMSVRAVPVLEPDGSLREWIGVHTDITERKRAEKALKESEHRYAQLLDSVQDMVFCKAPGSVVVYANKAACKYYGMTLEQLRGITDVPFNKLDYTQQYLQDDLQVFTTGQPLDIPEEPNVRADGEIRFFHTIKSPIFDTKGNVVQIVGVSRDITDRKQEQEARTRALVEAQAARAELQRVFMQAPAAIQTSRGPNHVTETANPLYIQIVGKRDLLGKPVREAFPELEGQGFFELLDQVYESGKPFVGNEMRAVFDRNGDGILEESFWNFVYQPLVDADGKVYGIMTHAVEVTQQVRARQEIEKKAEELTRLTQALERSNHELDQFAYVTSHDLKAPLRGIANLSEWIEEDVAEQLTDESREHLNLLRKRVYRMEALINGILQYSRAGRVQEVETVDVSALLSEVIELLAPPPEVLIVVESGMPTLKTERIPLEQIFMNLIGNAIKYAQRSDVRVQVSVREMGKYYEFAIADNGSGIAPEYQQKIWQIFQRLEARDKVEGTGVGLSIVKKIVESRGGRVWVESEVGAGATFYFTWFKRPRVYFKT